MKFPYIFFIDCYIYDHFDLLIRKIMNKAMVKKIKVIEITLMESQIVVLII